MPQKNTLVSRSAPQAHPIFLLKPVQYPTPNQPATIIRPILSSNIPSSTSRPPIVRRLLRPALIRPVPPNENSLNRNEPVSIQRRDSSTSSIPSTISSIDEKIPKQRTYYSCLPCCRVKDEQARRKSPRLNVNYPNLKMNTRTTYIVLILLFLFFLIVIILLIVLIVVRR